MHGRVALVASPLLAAFVLSGCGSSVPTPSLGERASPTATATPTPTPTASPSPTPTPVPTPLPTLPTLDVGTFGAGWTLAASSTNVGEKPGTAIRSTIGPRFSVVAACTGEGTMTITLRATGRSIKDVAGQPPGVEAGSMTVDCPSVEPTATTFKFTAADWHGVLIDPQVTAPGGVDYTVLVGTHG